MNDDKVIFGTVVRSKKEVIAEAMRGYREGRIRFVASKEISSPAVVKWLQECDTAMASELERQLLELS